MQLQDYRSCCQSYCNTHLNSFFLILQQCYCLILFANKSEDVLAITVNCLPQLLICTQIFNKRNSRHQLLTPFSSVTSFPVFIRFLYGCIVVHSSSPHPAINIRAKLSIRLNMSLFIQFCIRDDYLVLNLIRNVDKNFVDVIHQGNPCRGVFEGRSVFERLPFALFLSSILLELFLVFYADGNALLRRVATIVHFQKSATAKRYCTQ